MNKRKANQIKQENNHTIDKATTKILWRDLHSAKKKTARIIVGGWLYIIIIVLKCIKSETTCQFDRSVKLKLCTQDFWVGSSVSFWMAGESQLARRVLGMNLLQRACSDYAVMRWQRLPMEWSAPFDLVYARKAASRKMEDSNSALPTTPVTCT